MTDLPALTVPPPPFLSDPALRAVLAALVLRARVELARVELARVELARSRHG